MKTLISVTLTNMILVKWNFQIIVCKLNSVLSIEVWKKFARKKCIHGENGKNKFFVKVLFDGQNGQNEN